MAQAREGITPALLDAARGALTRGGRVGLSIPGGGRLYIDRPVPFLALHRFPPSRPDAGTRRLVTGQAAYLQAPGVPEQLEGLRELLEMVAQAARRAFGAMLLLELWTETHTSRPTHTIYAPPDASLDPTVQTLHSALREAPWGDPSPEVEVRRQPHFGPDDLPSLSTPGQGERLSAMRMGLSVPPLHQAPGGQEVYPVVLRRLRRLLGQALSRTFFTFMQTRTTARPAHHQALGRRADSSAVWEVDRRLAEISEAFQFTLQITPTNVEEAWRAFRASHFQEAPWFAYRPLPIDPMLHKRRLYEVPIERIEDPALAHLFSEKVAELDRQITMLADRDTPRFLYGSLQLFGPVEDRLHALALRILDAVPSRSREPQVAYVDAQAFADEARKELENYQEQHPAIGGGVDVREDVAGLMHARGRILVGADSTFARSRVEPLLQHEIGTHLVCYHNGRRQPFRQLYAGLPGYRELQEGLAVVSEYLVRGLDAPRLRVLAARVVAARAVSEGSTLVETYHLLNQEHGMPEHAAWRVAMRVHRGGGTLADAVYLRGLVELLDHLAESPPIEPLLVGRVAMAHLPIVQELLWREVLQPPAVRPHYLDRADAQPRLAALGEGLEPLDLVDGG